MKTNSRGDRDDNQRFKGKTEGQQPRRTAGPHQREQDDEPQCSKGGAEEFSEQIGRNMKKATTASSLRTTNGSQLKSVYDTELRQLLGVLTAFKRGNFSVRLPEDWTGLVGKVADTFNEVIETNERMSREFERIWRVVGKEGRISQRISLGAVSEGWADSIGYINTLIGDLVHLINEMSRVIGAVAKGDLSEKMARELEGRSLQGEFLQTAKTVNAMVDQLGAFASEVTRVAREVGTEGKLGGQAKVKGVAGTWKDLTENVNLMAGNLTAQVRNIATVTTAVAKGDLTKKITVDVKGEFLGLKDTVNVMVDQLRSFASEVTRVAREVGSEGILGGQARVEGVSGTWKDLTDSVNFMARNLTGQVRNIATVTTAVARGDLSKKITVDVRGEILALKDTINTMVDQLSSFASEVTRVAREVGTEGKLGGQADVKGVAGTWKDLTENVNLMANNLTAQVRNIAEVTTAVACGDLSKKITVDVRGEILELKNTINTMVDQLSSFAAQVTRVAREVGTEGKLGGQASVPGAAGTWRDLTDNVNQLAGNLTSQLRAIADVATAVTTGDLTRSIKVAARGEVALVKDNINEMIRNLRDTTSHNNEQDWLKTNLARFSRMLQGQRDSLAVARMILSELAPVVSAQQGVFYIIDNAGDGGGNEPELKLLASYAYRDRKSINNRFKLGEGLIGQAALEKERILITNVPDDYVTISSGLGAAAPRNIIVLPILFEGQVKAVMELSTAEEFNPTHRAFLDQLSETIGIALNNIEANTRTEDLLKQSQSLTLELQNRQNDLQQTNEELEEKARQLSEQKAEVERKNREVEQARQALEDKAQQLSITSRYKSEFLANMSHELRTPLNSLLILAEQLTSNPEGNLSEKQVEFAKTIRDSGVDLLKLINDILDLSKVESGTVTVDVGEVHFRELQQNLERNFRPMAENKELSFEIAMDENLPSTIHTDGRRLDQILKNLLSNAFKFTESGYVKLQVAPVTTGWSSDHLSLNRAKTVFAFSVSDSGIGISPEKQATIFGAFQQADGSTNRRYGGTGLGLTISRELARLLGGEIKLKSQEGRGSTFTLFLPDHHSLAEKETTVATRSPDITQSTEPKREPGISPSVDFSTPDDRFDIVASDKTILIVEEDVDDAQWLLESAHDAGFKAIVTPQGRTVTALARKYAPTAIALDFQLSDIDGARLLERIKSDSTIRHIPVIAFSRPGLALEKGFKLGAIAALEKPMSTKAIQTAFRRAADIASRKIKKLLVIEDDPHQRTAIRELVGAESVQVIEAPTGAEALTALQNHEFDCVILDLLLPDISGFKLLEQIRAEHQLLPIVVYTGKDLSQKEEEQLNRLTQTIIVKDVRSPERLYDQVALRLHHDVSKLPADKRDLLQRLYDPNEILVGKKILIVDDDTRNNFAMKSLLEPFEMKVISAETGKGGIEALQKSSDVDLVLMDIMLPGMDGYDTIRAIRQMHGFNELPIIALTAKAMKGDREKCIDAGASDYIAKPVEIEKLLSLLRNWLVR